MTTETTIDLFPLLGEAVQALSAPYADAMRQATEQAGMEAQDLWWLLAVQGDTQQPTTLDRLQRLRPYTAGAVVAAQLSGAVERGLLAADAAGSYRLSETGLRGLKQTFAAVHAALAGYTPLPRDDMQRIVELLRRIIDASVAAPEPLEKPDLISSRLTDPGANGSAAARIDQYATDLLHYRDDVHQAAWRPLGLSGPAWEIFTFIWRGEASTLEALQQQLERRGHAQQEYSQFLEGLTKRGWIEETAGAYTATAQGRRLREQAEETTNRLFYAPWLCLSESEIETLRELLIRLRETSHEPEQEQTG
jgi:DNA-binding MarR family transcriptional regulator